MYFSAGRWTQQGTSCSYPLRRRRMFGVRRLRLDVHPCWHFQSFRRRRAFFFVLLFSSFIFGHFCHGHRVFLTFFFSSCHLFPATSPASIPSVMTPSIYLFASCSFSSSPPLYRGVDRVCGAAPPLPFVILFLMVRFSPRAFLPSSYRSFSVRRAAFFSSSHGRFQLLDVRLPYLIFFIVLFFSTWTGDLPPSFAPPHLSSFRHLLS